MIYAIGCLVVLIVRAYYFGANYDTFSRSSYRGKDNLELDRLRVTAYIITSMFMAILSWLTVVLCTVILLGYMFARKKLK